MHRFKHIEPGTVPVSHLHSQLLAAVAPRPIAFASTIDRSGNPNLSPFSFFNVFSANPPVAIFSPARRVRDNTGKHTLENVLEVPEVVINIVNYAMVQQTSLASTEYPKGTDEFVKAGFTKLASDKVKPFRVAESPVQLECKVKDVIALGDHGGAGNLVICEVVMMHINENVLNEKGMIIQDKMDLVARLGYNWYSRVTADSLFEVPKPLTTLGIGVDNIPEVIRQRQELNGNDLGMLGNVESIPAQDEVKEKINTIAEAAQVRNAQEAVKLARELLGQGKVREAWYVLLNWL